MAKWVSRDLIGLSLTSLFNDLSHEMTLALLPAFVSQLTGVAAAPLVLGTIMGLADATATAFKLFSGWLAQRIDYVKPLLVIGYTLTPLCVGLIGLAHHIWFVTACQIIAWMGKGLREPMRDVWLADISSEKNYGKTFGLQRAFDTIGAILGPLVALYALNTFTLSHSFFIAFIPGIFSITALVLLTTNRPHRTSHTADSLVLMHSFPPAFKQFLWALGIFGIGNFSKTLLLLRAQHMLLGHSTWLLATGISIALYVLLNIIRALAEFFIGYLSDILDRKTLLALFGFGSFALVNSMLLITTYQVGWWIIIFLAAGTSLGTVTSLEKSYAAQLLPSHIRGIGFGILQTIDGIGDLVSSIVVGFLWSYSLLHYACIYTIITSLAALIMLQKIPKLQMVRTV